MYKIINNYTIKLYLIQFTRNKYNFDIYYILYIMCIN